MRAREVIPFGKSVEEMEMKGGGKEAYREKKFRGTFIPSYRMFVICILDFFF